MSSLKSIDKRVSKRRQIYKPILDNPFTNESHLWPHVEDLHFIWELVRSTILSKVNNYADIPLEDWPWDIMTSYNDIVSCLSESKAGEGDVILFACNKDSGVPSVLLQQIPLLCYTSDLNVKLVQLPKGSLSILQESFALSPLRCVDGLLLLRCNDKLNESFVSQIQSKVEDLKFPWLDPVVKYHSANVKLVKTSIPLSK